MAKGQDSVTFGSDASKSWLEAFGKLWPGGRHFCFTLTRVQAATGTDPLASSLMLALMSVWLRDQLGEEIDPAENLFFFFKKIWISYFGSVGKWV